MSAAKPILVETDSESESDGHVCTSREPSPIDMMDSDDAEFRPDVGRVPYAFRDMRPRRFAPRVVEYSDDDLYAIAEAEDALAVANARQHALAQSSEVLEEGACVLCLGAKATHAWVPCNHLVVCTACVRAAAINLHSCPVCRAEQLPAASAAQLTACGIKLKEGKLIQIFFN